MKKIGQQLKNVSTRIKLAVAAVLIVGGASMLIYTLFIHKPLDCALPMKQAHELAAQRAPNSVEFRRLLGLQGACGISAKIKAVNTSSLTAEIKARVSYSADLAKVAYALNNKADAKTIAQSVMKFNAGLSVQQRTALQKDNNRIADMLLISLDAYTASPQRTNQKLQQ